MVKAHILYESLKTIVAALMQAGESSWGTKANIIDSIRSCFTLRVVKSYMLHSKEVLSMVDTQFQSAQTMNWDSYISATEGRKLLPDERKRKKTKARSLLDSIQTKYCPYCYEANPPSGRTSHPREWSRSTVLPKRHFLLNLIKIR